MSWIILILAGLMEVGFTFCLGKTKTATGQTSIGHFVLPYSHRQPDYEDDANCTGEKFNVIGSGIGKVRIFSELTTAYRI